MRNLVTAILSVALATQAMAQDGLKAEKIAEINGIIAKLNRSDLKGKRLKVKVA